MNIVNITINSSLLFDLIFLGDLSISKMRTKNFDSKTTLYTRLYSSLGYRQPSKHIFSHTIPFVFWPTVFTHSEVWVSCLKWRHTKTEIVKLNCKTRNTWLLFAGESVVSDWPSFRAQIRDSCFSNAFLHAQPPGQPDRTQFLSFLPKTTPPRHFPPSIHSVKFVSKFSQGLLWHLVHILIDWRIKVKLKISSMYNIGFGRKVCCKSCMNVVGVHWLLAHIVRSFYEMLMWHR